MRFKQLTKGDPKRTVSGVGKVRLTRHKTAHKRKTSDHFKSLKSQPKNKLAVYCHVIGQYNSLLHGSRALCCPY